MQVDGCLFCKIVTEKIPSKKVFDRGGIFAFRDINPAAPTHILIVPKDHVKDISELGEDHGPLLAEIFQAAKELASEDGISETGYRVVANVGRHGGQSVFHLHFHLLGGRHMGWPPG